MTGFRRFPVLAGLPLLLTLAAPAVAAEVPRLLPDLTGAELRDLVSSGRYGFVGRFADPELQKVLDAGKRQLDWIDKVNAGRPAAQALQLTSAAATVGYPIDAPKYYNPTIVKQEFADALAAMPAAVKTVLQGSGALPATLPVDDEAFLKPARDLDRAYQDASRWLLMEPYLDELKSESTNDVRGYYGLAHEPNLASELAGWKGLTADVQDRLSGWLVGLCHNGGDAVEDCRTELTTSEGKDGGVKSYYDKYEPAAKELWDHFFRIDEPRTDIDWTKAAPNVMNVPFVTPDRADVKAWLASNIEDEWRLGDWQLRLAFSPDADTWSTPHVEFQAGVTPHVNGLGGNVITMDGNRALSDYLASWTIRHEFGHVLGFPDCYVEFYDEAREAMITYQLDITNLMCSRRGHLQAQHVDELRRVYFKN